MSTLRPFGTCEDAVSDRPSGERLTERAYPEGLCSAPSGTLRITPGQSYIRWISATLTGGRWKPDLASWLRALVSHSVDHHRTVRAFDGAKGHLMKKRDNYLNRTLVDEPQSPRALLSDVGKHDPIHVRRRVRRRGLGAECFCGGFLRVGCCWGVRPRELLGVRPRTMPISSSMRSVVSASSQARPIWD